jgi:hypothetical protein
VLAALSLDFDDRRSAGDVEAAVSRIEREIKATFPEVTRVFVEAKDRNASGPGISRSCRDGACPDRCNRDTGSSDRSRRSAG